MELKGISLNINKKEHQSIKVDDTPEINMDVKNLFFGYKSKNNMFPVLEDISLSIKGAQLVSILGPNGVGKSTFIHCLNKILEPVSGCICINGSDIKDVPIKELAKFMGYVPYSTVDNFPLSVTDTILMGRHPHSKWGSLDDDLKVVYETMELIGITDLAERNFNELSAGQHQKVTLARGLAQEPKILFLDEPTSNLDIRFQLEITRLLKRLSRQKNMLVIMISHDINIASKYSDTIIMMYDRGIYALGRPKDVITSENISKVYQVGAKIIDDNGKPHVILVDNDDTNYDDDHQFSVIATKSGETYKGP